MNAKDKKMSESILKGKPTKKETSASKETEEIIRAIGKHIKDPHMKKEATSIIRALDLKKWRNTSET